MIFLFIKGREKSYFDNASYKDQPYMKSEYMLNYFSYFDTPTSNQFSHQCQPSPA